MNEKDTHSVCIVLFDSDLTTALINKRVLPTTVTPSEKQLLPLRPLIRQWRWLLPREFVSRSLQDPSHLQLILMVFGSPTLKYDFIVGCNVLNQGFILDHKNKMACWDRIKKEMTKKRNASP